MDISSLRERSFDSALSVSELNGYIKRVFDSDRVLNAVTVKGEISNFTNHRSGHLYFSLKDNDGQIRAVMFSSRAVRLKFMPENGMKVIIHGSVSVYQRDGTYQLYVNSMQPDGIGALYLAFEQLKEKLFNEGLFDEAKKKDIPRFPERIGIITSPTGAAVRDIINVTGRRFPKARIYLYPALVQGEGAEEDLIKAIDYFDSSRLCDVIIIGRGGGSIEDLWAFNSEALARRIFAANVPVISAVGHETDFTICDFVSDMRAPTPSAAAELAVPDIREIYMMLSNLFDRAEQALIKCVERKRERLDIISGSGALNHSQLILGGKRELLTNIYKNACRSIEIMLSKKSDLLVLNSEKLNALSPLAVLKRGYSIVETEKGVVNSIKDINIGELVHLTLTDGEAEMTVSDIKER